MQSIFPTETQGDGRIRRQYLKAFDGQGGGVKTRRVSCRICGFPGADLVQHDNSGGSLAGDGAGGAISLQSDGEGDQQGGDGNQTYNRGGGCPLCFSKNFHGPRQFDEFVSTPSHFDVLR